MHLPFAFTASTRALVSLAGAAIVLFFTVAVAQRTAHTFQLHQEASNLETVRNTLETRRVSLAEERQRLQDGTDVETIARRELNLIKPGETAVVVLPSAAALERAKHPSAPDETAQPPFWEALWRGLFGG